VPPRRGFFYELCHDLWRVGFDRALNYGASGNQPSVSAVTFCTPNRARKRSQGFCPRQDLHQQSYNRDLWWVSLLLPLCLAAAVFLIIMIFGV
jgi:hypothetical protein